MSLPTSLSSGLISDSARGASRARPDLELRSAAPISRVALRSRHEHPANAPARPALRGMGSPFHSGAGPVPPPDQTLRGMAATVHGWPGGPCRHAQRLWDDHVSPVAPSPVPDAAQRTRHHLTQMDNPLLTHCAETAHESAHPASPDGMPG
jgi:hypothetical protein